MITEERGFGNALFVFLTFFVVVLVSAPACAEETAPSLSESGDTPEAISEIPSESGTGEGDNEPDGSVPEETERSGPSHIQLMSPGLSGESEEGEGTSSGSVGDISLAFVDRFTATGAATARIPIVVPPGRGGIAPNLALSYNSQRKNGWIGVGWDLDLGTIRRSSKWGVDYEENDFVFVRDGSSTELVPWHEWGENYYGAKIEEEFSKYYLNPSTGGWEVTGKDGTRCYYGTMPDSRQDNEMGVFKWCLDRVEDPNGNSMELSYFKDQGEIYLERIDYAGNGSLSPTNSVEFYLEDRIDNLPMFKTNFEVVARHRLKTIHVFGQGELARRYELAYTYSESTGRSLLRSVTLRGSEGGAALPPSTLDWHGGENTWRPMDSGVLRTLFYGFQYDDTYPMVVGDWNGDGRTDVGRVHRTGVSFYLSDGVDGWTRTRDLGDFGPNRAYNNVITCPMVVGDFNGDGRTDVGWVHSGGVSFYLSDGSGGWNRISGIAGLAPAQGFTNASVYPMVVGDFNGDGRTDVGRVHNSGVSLYLSDGSGGWVRTGDVGDFGPYQGYADTNTFPLMVGDWNGDGLTDLGRFTSRQDVRFYGSDGTGGWTKIGGIRWPLKQVPPPFKPRKSHDDERVRNPPINLAATYPVTVGDWNGDGRADVGGGFWGGFVFYGILSPVPDLLASFHTGPGSLTSLEYTPSSRYENRRLPFVVQTVSSITVDDGIGDPSMTRYDYSGGFCEDREFRGFEYVKQTNPDDTTEETWFHQDRHFKGRPYRVEVRGTEGGPLLTKTIFTWGKVSLDSTDNAAFVKLDHKRTEFDGNPAAYTHKDYVYDETNGNLIETVTSGTDGETITTTSHYGNYGDWLWRLEQETVEGSETGRVRETVYTYDASGNMLDKAFWLDWGNDPRIEMTYDAYGNPITETDAKGNRTTTKYDEPTQSYPVKVIKPGTGGVNHVERYRYDGRFGTVTGERDENGNWTEYTYDDFGRLIRIGYPDGGEVLKTYHDWTDGSDEPEFPRYTVTRVRESEGSTIDTYEYFDGLGRIIQTITFGEDRKPIVTRTYYDKMGRTSRVEGPFFGSGVDHPQEPPSAYPMEETAYDGLGRPIQTIRSDGEYGAVATVYRYSGYTTTITDPDGSTKTEERDYLGRVIEVKEHTNTGLSHTHYEYNAGGDLLSVTDARGSVTWMRYDTLGRKISMDDPDMGYWQYSYDANGNLLTQTDARGETTTFSYDALNRLTEKRHSTADPTVAYTYDNLSIPNGRGRLYAVTDSDVTTLYDAYDEMGRSKTVTKTITGDLTPYTTQYDYDLSGKPTRMTYPDGFQLSYTYHPGSGLLHAVSGSDAEEYAAFSFYEPTGKIGQVDHGNGTGTRYTYDPWSTRLLEIITADPSGAPENDIQSRIYRYTPAGDIKEITDELKGITYGYTYDKLHRLIAETNTGPYDSTSYEYDAIGNITLKAVGATTMSYTYHPTHKHAIERISLNGVEYLYTYDANGNMAAGPDFSDPGTVGWRAITYNVNNMPQQIEHTKGGRTVRTDFVYDGKGVRAKKVVQRGFTTYYIGEHFEITDGIETTKYIFAGPMRVAKLTSVFQGSAQALPNGNSVTSGAVASGGCYITEAEGAEKVGYSETLTYYHKDHLGSSTALTDTNGLKVETTEYMPFGHQRDHTGTVVSNYKYTDQELDPETGLYNYKARLYDPVIGRFISPDSIVPDPYDPQSLNRYSYCRNNPLVYVDPTGQFFDPADPAHSHAPAPDSFSENSHGGRGGTLVHVMEAIINIGRALSDWAKNRVSDSMIDGVNIEAKVPIQSYERRWTFIGWRLESVRRGLFVKYRNLWARCEDCYTKDVKHVHVIYEQELPIAINTPELESPKSLDPSKGSPSLVDSFSNLIDAIFEAKKRGARYRSEVIMESGKGQKYCNQLNLREGEVTPWTTIPED